MVIFVGGCSERAIRIDSAVLTAMGSQHEIRTIRRAAPAFIAKTPEVRKAAPLGMFFGVVGAAISSAGMVKKGGQVL